VFLGDVGNEEMKEMKKFKILNIALKIMLLEPIVSHFTSVYIVTACF